MKLYIKDFIFNNGLVNFYMLLNQKYQIKLESNYLEFELDDNDFNDILDWFLDEFDIVYQTDNDRVYFDEQLKKFILDKKFDVSGKSSGNDVKNVYSYKTTTDLNLSRNEIQSLFKDFQQKNDYKKNENIPDGQDRVIISITKQEAVKNYRNYLIKGDKLKFDSKIHTFENGGRVFREFLYNNDTISKWEALIYWFGGRIKRFYSGDYFLFLNSFDLKELYYFKKYIPIKEKRIENTISNIDFYNQLSKLNIKNPYFYITHSEIEFELKFFIYLFSVIIHIENNQKRREKLFLALQKMIFVVYVQDGDFKKSLNEYTKGYKLFNFFRELYENELFENFISIFTTISALKQKEINLYSKKFANNFLNFRSLRSIYFGVSFELLEKNKKLTIYKFENFYIEKILKGENMNEHELSKVLGESIGIISASLDDKDLLFKMRNIKNKNQLIHFFSEMEFKILKNNVPFSKEAKDSLKTILEILNNQNWEVIRDYMAIYAIDKFRAVQYAKKGE